jgi:hemerythrin
LIYGIEIAEEHFIHEEAVLLNGLKQEARTARFQAHLAAHEAILKKLKTVNAMTAELDKNISTAEAYRNLYYQTSAILSEHERLFDQPAIRHSSEQAT